MKIYKHIFFDLDRTLWDFDRSSLETAESLYEKYELASLGAPDFEVFYSKYHEINLGLWEIYRKGEISKEKLNLNRFHHTLLFFGIDELEVARGFAHDYITISPTGDYLYPHVKEMLEYLHDKYPLHIITNGFEEVQQTKIQRNDLGKFFKTITTSEMAGVKKPDQEIFHFALKQAGAEPHESLMVGDDIEVDIEGAKNVGMDGMFVSFNGEENCGQCKFTINSLSEIISIL